MCLESKRLFPQRAKGDIVVGKILLINRDKKLVTYFKDYPVTSLIMKTSYILFTIIYLWLFGRNSDRRYSVGRGMIHSYNLDSNDCLKSEVLKGYIVPYDSEVKLYVKAIIPKGALYYKDYWGSSYASNKLILKPSKEQLKYFKCNG